jgi:hypothetical protein
MLKIMATYQAKAKNKTPNAILKHELAKKLKLDKPPSSPTIRRAKKIAAAARKVMGRGKIGCWLDNAKAHHAKCVVAELEKHFDRVLFQPPSSPDMNMLDSGVFPHMGRLVQDLGCVTKSEIRAAVRKVWKNGVTKEHCGRVGARVRRNMVQCKGCGGNWFNGK